MIFITVTPLISFDHVDRLERYVNAAHEYAREARGDDEKARRVVQLLVEHDRDEHVEIGEQRARRQAHEHD